ncbi:lipase family alpha/beta hydrolase [Streptomyces sp. NPDC056121]|uniref:lipase family alpha/beta hydrolase n=1 Tax=Streptomyces TaxID=1883 RepID=UPI001D0B41BA|nr:MULTISPECIES: alpha/beta fold hydrolase [Streptomyces]MCX5083560.1 alpha/beta fold hydrolase [Streptomyces sp. NBC_00401]UDM01641.1 alpha/beta fold hydrolase [Streptomyces longhuiensis]
MEVTRILPFRPLCQLIPTRLVFPARLAGVSVSLLKATALEVAILAGHLLLYPSGIIQERRATPELPPLRYVPTPEGMGEGGDEASYLTESAALPGPGARNAHSTDNTDNTCSARLPAAESKPPVLLLHGFIDNRSVFVLLRRSLAQHGRHHVESLNYSPLTYDIRTAAALLARHVEEICERTGHDRVDIVGHSLGGLIARYYVQCLGGDLRVRTLVSLGTPHSGTTVAPLMDAHPIVRQMRPGSTVIEELSRPAPGCRTHFVSFWSDLDQIMVPLETACIDHPDLIAQNVRVTGVGHLALPVHPAVAAGIRQALDAEEAEGAHTTDGMNGLTVA